MADNGGNLSSFPRARGLWALAAIAVFAWGGVGFLHWQHSQPTIEDNWRELCKVTDCSRYREAHTTIEIGNLAIKVPHSRGPVKLHLSGSGDEEFNELDQSGAISRSVFRNAQSLTIIPCCGSLSYLIPSAIDVFVGERVDIHSSTSRWANQETQRISKIVEEHSVLRSWSDELDLLREGQEKTVHLTSGQLKNAEWAKALGTTYRELLLVTKVPVAFGRRALLKCDQWSCRVDLLPLEGQARLPVIVSIPFAEIQPTGDCISQPEGCLTREQKIRQLPGKLRNLEALITKLSA